MGEGRKGEGLLCLRGGRRPPPGREGGGGARPAKPLKAKPCGLTKASPGLEPLNPRQVALGWLGGWHGAYGGSGD